jgi:hypothetical protein
MLNHLLQLVSPLPMTYKSMKCIKVTTKLSFKAVERLMNKQGTGKNPSNLDSGIVDEEEDVLSSSSSSQDAGEILGGYDDPNNDLAAEDDDSDEDDDMNRCDTVTIE